MVAVNADALVRLTRAVLPAISPTRLRTDCPSGVRPPRQRLRIALRGQIRHSDVLPYRRGQCTQYRWAAMGLRHLSWMISTVHDESRTIPPGRRCARPTSRFTAGKSAPAGAAGHPGQHRAGGASGGDGRATRDQAAARGIRRNWAGSGTTPVAAVRASRIVRKGRATPATSRRPTSPAGCTATANRRAPSPPRLESAERRSIGCSLWTRRRPIRGPGLSSFARTAERRLVTRAQPSRSLRASRQDQHLRRPDHGDSLPATGIVYAARSGTSCSTRSRITSGSATSG